jgi:hypothetical protein
MNKYSLLGFLAAAAVVFAAGAQASLTPLGFDGKSAQAGSLVSGVNGTKTFTSNGHTWTANMNGDTSPHAAIYYYSASFPGVLDQYKPIPPSGGAIYLDGSQGTGTSRGGVGFNRGPSVSVQLNNLLVGQMYTIDFAYNTEINLADGRLFSNPFGNSKGGVAGILVGYSTDTVTPTTGLTTFKTTTHVPETNPHVPWDTASFSFKATASTGFVYFIDDYIDKTLTNETLSSNAFLADVSLIPEQSPLLMVGLALTGLVSFRTLRKRISAVR